MAGTRETESEYVMKVGKNKRGIANPANSPYCLVAITVVIPANAKLCETTIGSKKKEIDPINRLPVVGKAMAINS